MKENPVLSPNASASSAASAASVNLKGGVNSSQPMQFGKQKSRFVRRAFGYAITFAQVFADFATVFFTFIGGYFFYKNFISIDYPQTLSEFAGLAGGAGLVYVVILDRMGLYRRELSLLNVKELVGIFRTGLIAALILLSIFFYIRFTTFSRITFTVIFALTPLALYLQRQIFYRVHLLFHEKGWSQQRVLIYGAGKIGQQLAKRMYESPSLGLLPIAFLDDDAAQKGRRLSWIEIGPRAGVPIAGGEEVLEQAKQMEVDMILIALPGASFERNRKLVERCLDLGLEYAIVPNTYEKFIQGVDNWDIGGIPILRRHQYEASPYYLVAKRLIDFVVSTLLIVLLSPLVLILGLLIRFDSAGPVIFKQKRTGLLGKEFSFYKFRTMYVDSPQYAQTPSTQKDPRITPIGRFLRRTSLDELPQLFNVWRGDMSLVGPRPEMPFIVKEYTPLEQLRLLAKPGITGVWQISAVRGQPIHANLEYDLFYLEHRSILVDLSILVKTFLSVIRGIGAL